MTALAENFEYFDAEVEKKNKFGVSVALDRMVCKAERELLQVLRDGSRPEKHDFLELLNEAIRKIRKLIFRNEFLTERRTEVALQCERHLYSYVRLLRRDLDLPNVRVC